MASEKQIAANRANAQKSRGPRSAGGKARASRNSTRHGLAANFRKDPSAICSIEMLTKLLRQAGHAEQDARLAAVAEYEMRSALKMRSKMVEALNHAAESGASLSDGLQALQRIDRYEKRASSLKKRLFRKMQPVV
jgi:hypothetical protein